MEAATPSSSCTPKALQTQAKNVRPQNQELDLTLPQVWKLANKLPIRKGGKKKLTNDSGVKTQGKYPASDKLLHSSRRVKEGGPSIPFSCFQVL